MQTLRTNIDAVPVEFKQVKGRKGVQWEMQFLPQFSVMARPFDLRSTYVGPQLEVLLTIGVNEIDHFLSLYWLDASQEQKKERFSRDPEPAEARGRKYQRKG
jgi:hypothetical protein